MKQAGRFSPGPGAGARRAARGLRSTGPGHRRGGVRRGRRRVHARRRRHASIHRHRRHHRRPQPDHRRAHRHATASRSRAAGTWELYVRLRVGPSPPIGAQRRQLLLRERVRAEEPDRPTPTGLTANGLAERRVHAAGDKVVGGGTAQSNVWKWVKLSAFDGGEPPVAGFVVPAGGLTQTFQIAGRENGLCLDKFAFGRQGVFFTVFDLDNGLPGTTVPPPPPYTPPGPPIATGQPKFLGGVSSPSQNLNFTAYLNQVTPENGGKWGSVEGTRDVMNWGELDTRRTRCAQSERLPVPHAHAHLGQPAAGLDRERCRRPSSWQEIEEWFASGRRALPEHRLHRRRQRAAARSAARRRQRQLHRGARRQRRDRAGTGCSSRSAWRASTSRTRSSGSTSSASPTTPPTCGATSDIIHLLQAEDLIDTVGVQGHAFSTRVPSATHASIQAKLDAAGHARPADLRHRARHRRPDRRGPARRLPADLPGVLGAPGGPRHHAVGLPARPLADGAGRLHRARQRRRAAGDGLADQDYVRERRAAAVDHGEPGAARGDGRRQRELHLRRRRQPAARLPVAQGRRCHRRQRVGVDADAGARTTSPPPTPAATTASVSNGAGVGDERVRGAQRRQGGSPQVTLSGLVQTYDGTPRVVTGASVLPAGLVVAITYNGSPTPPTLPGSYAIVGTIVDANYVGTRDRHARGVGAVRRRATRRR